jgi:hypothetical protein
MLVDPKGNYAVAVFDQPSGVIDLIRGERWAKARNGFFDLLASEDGQRLIGIDFNEVIDLRTGDKLWLDGMRFQNEPDAIISADGSMLIGRTYVPGSDRFLSVRIPLAPSFTQSFSDIAQSAHAVMLNKVLPLFSGCTQAQWAEDKTTSRLTGETRYVKRAERAFILQGFATDLLALVHGRPRLREFFPSSGPTVPSELPVHAREMFTDASEGGVFSRAGQIETGVADRRVRYSPDMLADALNSIKPNIDPGEFESLQLAMKLLSAR